ncbi:MAG: hypothetical protein ACI9TH_003139 [Kiritimatiellia bacterium]|jgi:hypothetical protein
MRILLRLLLAGTSFLYADGLVVPPVNYTGSLNEKAQEAILIFFSGTEKEPSLQDLILKITVEGEARNFGWLVPLPAEPRSGKEDAALFHELHQYVQSRTRPPSKPKKNTFGDAASGAVKAAVTPAVEVLERKVVGSYDLAIVREHQAGALKGWLQENQFQVPEQSDDLIAFYREKQYVFACMKVSDVVLQKDQAVDLHPIRFSFSSGGRDGIFFPMRMTGLQKEPFDINLYVFYDKWINNDLSPYGFVHRGFNLRWRDFDSRDCTPNAGKSWSAPQTDPYLASYARRLPNVTQLMQKLHPGKTFYLTNLYAKRLEPTSVLDWSDDLWLFPFYADRDFVPFDARKGGPAMYGYP